MQDRALAWRWPGQHLKFERLQEADEEAVAVAHAGRAPSTQGGSGGTASGNWQQPRSFWAEVEPILPAGVPAQGTAGDALRSLARPQGHAAEESQAAAAAATAAATGGAGRDGGDDRPVLGGDGCGKLGQQRTSYAEGTLPGHAHAQQECDAPQEKAEVGKELEPELSFIEGGTRLIGLAGEEGLDFGDLPVAPTFPFEATSSDVTATQAYGSIAETTESKIEADPPSSVLSKAASSDITTTHDGGGGGDDGQGGGGSAEEGSRGCGWKGSAGSGQPPLSVLLAVVALSLETWR